MQTTSLSPEIKKQGVEDIGLHLDFDKNQVQNSVEKY